MRAQLRPPSFGNPTLGSMSAFTQPAIMPSDATSTLRPPSRLQDQVPPVLPAALPNLRREQVLSASRAVTASGATQLQILPVVGNIAAAHAMLLVTFLAAAALFVLRHSTSLRHWWMGLGARSSVGSECTVFSSVLRSGSCPLWHMASIEIDGAFVNNDASAVEQSGVHSLTYSAVDVKHWLRNRRRVGWRVINMAQEQAEAHNGARTLKTLVFAGNDAEGDASMCVVVVVFADDRVNEGAVGVIVGTTKPRLASASTAILATGFPIGDIGPVGPQVAGLRVVIDSRVAHSETPLLAGVGSPDCSLWVRNGPSLLALRSGRTLVAEVAARRKGHRAASVSAGVDTPEGGLLQGSGPRARPDSDSSQTGQEDSLPFAVLPQDVGPPVLIDDPSSMSILTHELNLLREEAVEFQRMHLVETNDAPPMPVLGVDCEWEPEQRRAEASPVATLQLATRRRAFVVDLVALMDRNTSSASAENELGRSGGDRDLPPCLCALDAALGPIFLSPHVIIAGLGLKSDLQRLAATLPLQSLSSVTSVVDVETLVRAVRPPLAPKRNLSGLARLSRAVLGFDVDKTCQVSPWGSAQRPLAQPMVEYAALDAYLPVQLFDALAQRVASPLRTVVDFDGASDLLPLRFLDARSLRIMDPIYLAMKWLGRPVPVTVNEDGTGRRLNAKDAAILLATMVPPDDAAMIGKGTPGWCAPADEVRGFERRGGVVALGVGFCLFVTIDEGFSNRRKYPNTLSRCSIDGSIHMTWWMPHNAMSPDSPLRARLFGGDEPVLLFGRVGRRGFQFWGRLTTAPEHIGGSEAIKWVLMDGHELVERSASFKRFFLRSGCS